MLSKFADNRGSLVVEMLDESDISIGIYWHKDKFDNLINEPIEGRVIIDGNPALELSGSFIRNDYLRMSSPKQGLLKHIFSAGSQGRLEYGPDGWATFGLNGTSRAVEKLHDCWVVQKSQKVASTNTENVDVPLTKMNVFLYADDATKSARLAATACNEEEAGECISHHLACDAEEELSAYIAGDDDPSSLIRMITQIVQEPYDAIQAEVVLDGGKVKIGLPIYDVSMGRNDMNGTWDMVIKFSEAENFFNAINDNQNGDAFLKLPGSKLTLTSLINKNENLLAFRDKCRNYRGK